MVTFDVGPATELSVPAPSLRERRKAAARLNIARAALRLFREKGYEATTAAEIAEAADYSERSFYRYFSTKEEVVFFDIEHLLEEVRAAIGDVPPGVSLWEVIRDSVIGSVERFQEPGLEFAAEVLRTWMTDSALAGPFLRFCSRWHQVLAEAWSNAYGSGNPENDLDAQLVAHYVVSTCQAAFRVHVHSGQELRPLLRAAFDQLDRGMAGYTASRSGPAHRAAEAAAATRVSS